MTEIIVKKSLTGKRWLKPQPNPLVEEQLENHDLSPWLVDILATRGINPKTIEGFLNPTLKSLMPNPFSLKDMDVVVDRVMKALNEKQKIGIIGDYDVDGATSTALLTNYLRAIGGDVQFHIPDRLTEGYGPSEKALQHFKDTGVQLVFTLDCGTVAFDEMQFARTLGLEVIILDHHQGLEKLPQSVGVVNPNRADETSGLTYLAAVGVTFMTLVALQKRLKEQGYFKDTRPPNLMDMLDVVALGTVCDVVPLQGLNRALVKQGLKIMANTQNRGLSTLMEHAGIKGLPSAMDMGFGLGPRINAGGRVGCSKLGATLLTTQSLGEAHAIAEKLNLLNEERRGIQQAVLHQAQTQVDPASQAIVVAGAHWHEGVIGVVAGRLKDKYHRPTVVIALNEEEGKASCRSVPGFDIGAFIHKAVAKGILIQGGGHAMAGGFSIKKERVEELEAFLTAEVAAHNLDLTPEVTIDTALSPAANLQAFLDDTASLAPHGTSNPPLTILLEDVTIKFVKLLKEKHLSFNAAKQGTSLRCLLFNAFETPLGDFILKHENNTMHLVGELAQEEWNGNHYIKFFVRDGAFL